MADLVRIGRARDIRELAPIFSPQLVDEGRFEHAVEQSIAVSRKALRYVHAAGFFTGEDRLASAPSFRGGVVNEEVGGW
jgi:hypothetical protein